MLDYIQHLIHGTSILNHKVEHNLLSADPYHNHEVIATILQSTKQVSELFTSLCALCD